MSCPCLSRLGPTSYASKETVVNQSMPVAEIWGRMAMLLARNLPRNYDGDKLLKLWLSNPAAAFARSNGDVRWTRPGRTTSRRYRDDHPHGWMGESGDQDAYTDLAALLGLADAPPRACCQPPSRISSGGAWTQSGGNR